MNDKQLLYLNTINEIQDKLESLLVSEITKNSFNKDEKIYMTMQIMARIIAPYLSAIADIENISIGQALIKHINVLNHLFKLANEEPLTIIEGHSLINNKSNSLH